MLVFVCLLVHVLELARLLKLLVNLNKMFLGKVLSIRLELSFLTVRIDDEIVQRRLVLLGECECAAVETHVMRRTQNEHSITKRKH